MEENEQEEKNLIIYIYIYIYIINTYVYIYMHMWRRMSRTRKVWDMYIYVCILEIAMRCT